MGNKAKIGKLEYELASFIRSTEQGKTLDEIMQQFGLNVVTLRSLAKLEFRGVIVQCVDGSIKYTIQHFNWASHILWRRVRCPKCFTAREVYDAHQTITNCAKKECRSPSGYTTIYHLRGRRVPLPKGEYVLINRA